jgi:16S rRNA (cytidine1402-2'-O)-methyltransferase
MSGTLYIVATPIGNLEDITFRALRILMEVDLILCEDTRVTKKLLNHFNIKKSTISYHQHSRLARTNEILDYLKQGKQLALVSDAGTPGIQDPVGKLIVEVQAQLGDEVRIVPVPGVSAPMTLASISGFNMDRFLFLGFLPTKKGREKIFKKIKTSKLPVVFFESPHRILKTLKSLSEVIPERYVVVGRELTKNFETIYRGRANDILEQLKEAQVRGEFVVIVG